jgi:hypothetical protein
VTQSAKESISQKQSVTSIGTSFDPDARPFVPSQRKPISLTPSPAEESSTWTHFSPEYDNIPNSTSTGVTSACRDSESMQQGLLELANSLAKQV